MNFSFSRDYILEDDRVRLEPLNRESVEELNPILDDDSVWKFITNKENLGSYLVDALKKRELNAEYPFAIFDKVNGCYVGSTRLYEVNKTHNHLRMGHTWLGSEYWGKRLNLHYKYLLFKFVFEEVKAERIGFGVHARNEKSIRAMKKVGCSKEGTLKNFLRGSSKNEREDLILFGIIKEEWMKVKSILETRINHDF